MSEKSKASPSPPPLSRQMALALVCNSNVNRSLEGHRILKEKGFGRVWSYGVGSKVRLPGIRGPSVYMFGTPFEAMQRDLENKNYNWYKDRGILDMLDRDAKVKKAPRRWQDEKKRNYDLILAYDIRAYNILIEEFESSRGQLGCHPVHIIGWYVEDRYYEAREAAETLYKFICKLHSFEDWQTKIASLVDSFFETDHKIEVQYRVCFTS
mmetsp:Transcript_4784/g.5924  ORF Transcript_4784/g.5924 Transcript_4784/m.5924 type:complete len:210 (-) Transcript_4784:203-832(-)